MSASNESLHDVTAHPHALQLFTDREDAIRVFERLLASDADDALPVLCYYGVGGVGKTLLLQKLCEVLREDYKGLPFARVSFDLAETRNLIAALTSLRVRFGQDFGLDFPHFDLPRAVFTARGGGPREDMFATDPWLQAAFDTVTAIFAPAGAARAGADRGIDEVLRRHPEVEERLRIWGDTEGVLRLRALDDQQLLSELIHGFAQDLSNAAPARDRHTCRAVIFLDTYEKLWEGIPGGAASPQGAEQEAWVRELHACLRRANSTLVVIAGRDGLQWRDDDPVEPYLIGGLSLSDTQLYLSRCGVHHPPSAGDPTPLQRAIFDCASADHQDDGALPFYVGLCANIVHQERGEQNLDPPPETFADIPAADVAERLAARFLRSLPDPDLAELVRSLSVPRWFDRTLVNERVGGSADRQRSIWRTLMGFSFMESSPDDDTVTLHAVMREALLYLLDEDRLEDVTEVHEWMRDHWSSREDDPRAEREAWYHWLHLEPRNAIEEWCVLAGDAHRERDSVRGRGLIEWMEGIDLTENRWREALGEQGWANALYDVACRLDDLRVFSQQPGHAGLICIALLNAALQIWEPRTRPHQWGGAQTLLGKAWQQLPIGDHSVNLQNAIKCYEAALRVCDEKDSSLNWAAVQNNLGGAWGKLCSGDRTENLQCAVECFEAARQIYTEEHHPCEWAMVQSNLGVTWRNLSAGDRAENLQSAIECFEAALSVYTKEDYPLDWAMIQNNLGNAWSDWSVATDAPDEAHAANLRKAIQHYEAALDIHVKEHFPEDWAMAQFNAAIAHRDLAPLEQPTVHLAAAERHVQNALHVFTVEAFPHNHEGAEELLAQIQEMRRELDEGGDREGDAER